MKTFSGVQGEILKANKKNQLVSAGAGSGKTTVMIEKIAGLLLEKKVEVENLLIVTFTVLAAGEMKERLIKKLKEELNKVEGQEQERILSLIEKLDTANIDTIDGFASKTIKKYFYDLNISPNIEIISDATKDYYLTKAMKKTFDEASKEKLDVELMLDLFGGNRRNFDNLEDLIMSSYNNIINLQDYEKFLQGVVGEYENSIKSECVVNEYICNTANRILRAIRDEYSIFTNQVQEKLNMVVENLNKFNFSVSFKTNLQSLNGFESVRFSQKEKDENEGLKQIIDEIKNLIEIKDDLEKNKINLNYEENNQKIINYLLIFINLLKKFIKNYNKIKEKNNLIDFNDLNRLMLKLLENENIRHELQNKFHYIFIDEYQDVNPLQDELMNRLTGESTTVFMVGDVKQSIYGFRGSSPEWFLSKYDKMKKFKETEDVFDMNVNFRSCPTILNFINIIFNKLMTKEIADIDYKSDCEIEPKRDDIVDEKVKILLVEKTDENVVEKGVYSVKNNQYAESKRKDKEAVLVAKTITELIGTEFYDANSKSRRKLTYSDIAILTHSDKDEKSLSLIDALKQCAIPLNLNNKLEVDSSEIIRLVLSILKCITKTADDVDYLATFLSLTDLTIDDVTEIRDKNFSFYENLKIIQENLIKNDIFLKINSGFEILEEITQASYTMTNSELISYILNNKKLKYYILQKQYGEKELKLLEEFVMKLSSVEDALGLAEFIEVVESNVNANGDFTSIDKEDSVTLQTIHKSKGLEYPVVILYNSSKTFSYLRDNDAINFNADIGFGVDYFDTSNRIKMDSLTKFAIRLANNKKGYKEELRLLYVALTRAKNKLIITGTISNKKLGEINKTSYTNMLLSCFENQITENGLEKEHFKIEFVEDLDLLKIKNNEDRDFDVVGENFSYINQEKFNIPLKNTVTGINSEHYQSSGYEIKNVFNKSTQYETEDRVLTGVHYHSALEMLDLTKEYIKNTDFKDVDYNKIKLAHERLSPLAKNAVNIKKEADFMMYVPYSEITNSTIQDRVLVQGVVDLIVEKENSIILVDYKFSRLPANVLKEKYAEQLKLYKHAIEEAIKKPVEHMFIYSINTGELV